MKVGSNGIPSHDSDGAEKTNADLQRQSLINRLSTDGTGANTLIQRLKDCDPQQQDGLELMAEAETYLNTLPEKPATTLPTPSSVSPVNLVFTANTTAVSAEELARIQLARSSISQHYSGCRSRALQAARTFITNSAELLKTDKARLQEMKEKLAKQGNQELQDIELKQELKKFIKKNAETVHEALHVGADLQTTDLMKTLQTRLEAELAKQLKAQETTPLQSPQELSAMLQEKLEAVYDSLKSLTQMDMATASKVQNMVAASSPAVEAAIPIKTPQASTNLRKLNLATRDILDKMIQQPEVLLISSQPPVIKQLLELKNRVLSSLDTPNSPSAVRVLAKELLNEPMLAPKSQLANKTKERKTESSKDKTSVPSPKSTKEAAQAQSPETRQTQTEGVPPTAMKQPTQAEESKILAAYQQMTLQAQSNFTNAASLTQFLEAASNSDKVQGA